MFKGILYNALSKYSEVFIALAVTAILARLLTPAEFGLVALVFVFNSFFNLLGNMGLGPAIVQTRDLSSEDLRSIFSFSAVMAIFLTSIFFASAGLISRFYQEPELIPVVRLLSLSVFFNIISIVPRALNKKELRFKEMGIVSVGIQILTGIIAIILAFNDFSYYALVVQNVLSAYLFFSIFYFLYPVGWVRKINKAPLKKIASYSTYQFATNFLSYFSRNTDSLLIGKYFGNAALGFYNKSYALMQMPVFNITHVITPVLHPVLAHHQDDLEYIFQSYKKIVRLMAGIGFPLSIFLYFSAAELILLMFGSQWERSIPVFKILALSVGFQICLSSVNSIFQATNRTKLLFLYGVYSTFFIFLGIGYGVFVGENLKSIGLGLVLAFICNFFFGFYLLIDRALKNSFSNFLKIFVIPVISGILSMFVFYGVQQLEFTNLFWSLIVKTGILVIIMAAFMMLSKENRDLFFSFLKNKD